MKLATFLTAATAIGLLGSGAQASVHLWHISEVYSNGDGSTQYVELHTSFDGQQFFKTGGNNTRLNLLNAAGTTTLNTYFFPSDSSAPTANHHILVGTANLASLGVTPDFVLPSNFLATGGGQLSLVSDVFGTFITSAYPALPGGTQAYDPESAALVTSNATNYAGATAVAPEPITLAALPLIALTMRRRGRCAE